MAFKRKVRPVDDEDEVDEPLEQRPTDFAKNIQGLDQIVNNINPADLVLFELSRQPAHNSRHRRNLLRNFVRIFAPLCGIPIPAFPTYDEVRVDYSKSLSRNRRLRDAQLRNAELSGDLKQRYLARFDEALERFTDVVMAAAQDKALIQSRGGAGGGGGAGVAVTFEDKELGIRKPF